METEKFFIEGLLLLKPKVFTDERGYFFESFNEERYLELGIPARAVVPLLERCDRCFMQDNVSSSKRGVLRGLHFQSAPCAQGKLVSVLRGKVLDVAVDIREGSPTFGKYIAVELSSENRHQLWIPAGFAHGFLSLKDDTIFSYKVTAPYSKEHEGGIRYDDPDIGIEWPHVEGELIVSEKDRELPFLKELFNEKINGFTS